MLVLDIIPEFRLDIILLDTIPFSHSFYCYSDMDKQGESARGVNIYD